MRLQPLRDKTGGARARQSNAMQLPAPTKGWYIGENIAEAPPGTAYYLQNVFPRTDYVRVRRGSQEYATGLGAGQSITTLMPWNSGTISKMFAVANGKIFDVSSSGAVGAAVYTGLSNSYLQYTQFQGVAGSYLVAVNGVDAPITWNGSTWAASGITTTGSAFTNVSIFKNRMYFIEANSLNLWYLPVQAISGATTKFPMQGVFKYGGYLVAAGTWAIDSTSGIYEAFVVISSEGEVLMYDGDDPTTWALKGSYKLSKPLGKNCFSKAGGDLLVMTLDGVVPMSKVQEIDQIALLNAALTQPIQPAWRDAVVARGGLLGWQITMWPSEGMAIVNLPKQNSNDRIQYIVNARSGAWSVYTGWDANCFAVYNNNLYYGSSDGRVMQGEVGSADDGSNYTAIIFYSFTSLTGDVSHKQMKMIHPYQMNNILADFTVSVNLDFDTNLPNAPTSVVPNDKGPKWDAAVWDSANSVWSGALLTQSHWQTANGFGTVFAPILQMTLSSANAFADIRLFRTDVLFEQGEIIT